jgi:hypothetical protein
MRLRLLTIVAAASLILAAPAFAADTIDLKVLYAGNPGSDRSQDFTSFLEKHFAKVTATDFRKFQEDEAKGYDVVIFDWTSIYPRKSDGALDNLSNGISMPPAPSLSSSFDRPAILIGAAGGALTKKMSLKINWL